MIFLGARLQIDLRKACAHAVHFTLTQVGLWQCCFAAGSCSEVASALKHCSRCRWLRHRRTWQGRCVYEAPDGVFRPWLLEVGSDAGWGLCCSLCKTAHPDSLSPYVRGVKGSQGKETKAAKSTLQIADLLAHMQSHEHIAAVQGNLRQASVADQPPAKRLKSDACFPAPGQLHLSREVLQSAFGAQGAEYERRHALVHRSDTVNFPKTHGTATQHPRHVAAMASVAFEQDLQLLRRKQVKSICWSEDASEGFLLVKARYLLHDWSTQCRIVSLDPIGSKTSLAKSRAAETTIGKMCGSAELAQEFRKLVKAGRACYAFAQLRWHVDAWEKSHDRGNPAGCQVRVRTRISHLIGNHVGSLQRVMAQKHAAAAMECVALPGMEQRRRTRRSMRRPAVPGHGSLSKSLVHVAMFSPFVTTHDGDLPVI